MPPNAKSTRRAREIAHTRQDILEAAARVFATAGFHDATMQEIAREAGFTAASLYTYFASKDEIYQALVEDLRGGFVATFDAHVPSGLQFAQRLELLVERQLSFVATRRTALRLVFDLGPRRGAREVRGPAEYLKRMSAFLAAEGAGELRLPPDHAARVLFGLTQAVFLDWVVDPRDPRDPTLQIPAAAARVVDVFLHGAAAPDPARRAPHPS